jgi:hypothetical protein
LGQLQLLPHTAEYGMVLEAIDATSMTNSNQNVLKAGNVNALRAIPHATNTVKQPFRSGLAGTSLSKPTYDCIGDKRSLTIS